MSLEWFKNMLGAELNDEEMKSIPFPKLELTVHVTTKFLEIFGIASSFIIAPLAAFRNPETRNFKGLVAKSSRIGRKGVMLGLVAGPLMTYARMRQMDGIEPYYDRCFRLRNNLNQVRVDRSCYIGLAAGSIVSPLLLKSCPIFGAITGLSVGTVAAGIYNNTK